jgi:5-methylcytosine-specific restriction endonuclease McrA
VERELATTDLYGQRRPPRLKCDNCHKVSDEPADIAFVAIDPHGDLFDPKNLELLCYECRRS